MRPAVVDASVLYVALVDDASTGRHLRDRLLGHTLFAPEIIDLEVINVIRRQVLRKALAPDRARQAVADLAAVQMARIPHTRLLNRVWGLHQNITPYDAAYVAVAELLDAPLLTADVRLAKAPGIRCECELVT